MKTISIDKFAEIYNQKNKTFIIDVRTPAEYSGAHLKGAINIPLDKLNPESLIPEIREAEAVYVICQSGARSAKACQSISTMNNLISVTGGTLAAESAGLEIVKSQYQVISLERQVRIAAGALVLIGATLALTVNSNFLYLSAFVGAGLIFAGLTNTCGMAILLGKMPWNQRSGNE